MPHLTLSLKHHERVQIHLPDGSTVWLKMDRGRSNEATVHFDYPDGVQVHREATLREGGEER